MDTAKIEILLKAIELGSLSKAAAEYSYTPSAVSHILEGIEQELGARFIRRTHAGISVEEGCEAVVENLRQMVELEKKTVRLLSRRQSCLTIATYASLSKHLLPRIIKGFNREFPAVKVNVLVVEKMIEPLVEGVADLLIGERPQAESFCWEELLVDPYVAVLPAGHTMAGQVIARDALAQNPFILQNDWRISAYIGEERLKDLIKVDAHDDSSVIHMVKAELGVAILPSLSVKEEEGIVCAELEPKYSRTIGMIYRESELRNKKELRDLVRFIRSGEMA